MTDTLLQTIQAALVEGATDDARVAGASACRTLLGVLESKAGEPIAVPAAPPAPSPVAAVVSALRGTPPDQLLDLVIAKLRAVVPTDAAQPPFRLAIRTVKVPPR